VIKYGCVWDPLLFDWLDQNILKLLERDDTALSYAIGRSCEIKATIVARDEREHDLRAILNFGHTFGHAIEAATGYETYLHGEAVGLGMLMAADLSHRLGLIEGSVKERVSDLLGRAGLPTQMDKKVLAGAVRLVLLEKLGRAVVASHYDRAAFDATLTEYFG
jgi:3-dehydroquinate synthase